MDGKLWKRLYRIVARLCDSKRGKRQQFSEREIGIWYLWVVLNDRPLCWLQWNGHAPPELKGRRRPSASTMSRRLRSAALATLLEHVERWLTRPRQACVCKYIDAMPLPEARFGRAAKGYRLYVSTDQNHRLYAWRVLPSNVSEVRVAEQLIPALQGAGYLLGDGLYDVHRLYNLAHQHRHQLIAPRSWPSTGFGHRPKSAARLRACEVSREMLTSTTDSAQVS